MKIFINITALIVSLVTSILCYGTILKGYDLISPWWMRQFPGTEPLFLPFLWSFMYFDPSIAAFVAGLTASIMSRSKGLSIMIGVCLACLYFWFFGYRTASVLAHAFGYLTIVVAGFSGHFTGRKLSRRNQEDAPDLKLVR